ncbi:hypothetical protein DV736_g6609, partial [Chaetothyriales sp. CBS 134916]
MAWIEGLIAEGEGRNEAKVTLPKLSHILVLQESTLMMAAMNWGPKKGERMIAVDQMLIFLAWVWKKKTSLVYIRPPPAAATQKAPLRIREAS